MQGEENLGMQGEDLGLCKSCYGMFERIVECAKLMGCLGKGQKLGEVRD